MMAALRSSSFNNQCYINF